MSKICKDKIKKTLHSILLFCFLITKYEHQYIIKHKSGIKFFNLSTKPARNDLKASAIYLIFNEMLKDRTGNIEILDFLTSNVKWDGDIITNPPYKFAQEFVEKAMESVTEGHKVIMYLKLTFLETAKRRELFKKYPPKYIYVATKRLGCAPNGQFSDMENETESGAVCYAWYVWEKGFSGEPTIRWFNDK